MHQLLEKMQRFRGGLVFKAHSLCVSLNSRLESNKAEKKKKEKIRFPCARECNSPCVYRGTSLIRNRPPPKTIIGP